MSRMTIASSTKATLLGGASVLALLLSTGLSGPGRMPRHTPETAATASALPSGTATSTRTARATKTVTATATPTVTRTPRGTATATIIAPRYETPIPTPDGLYPELSAEIDKAIASIRLKPLPAELNPAEHDPVKQVTVFRWLLNWTPPRLEGLPGSKYRLPGGIPYQLNVDFEIHPEVRKPEYIVDYDLVVSEDHLTFNGWLASGVYHWRIRPDYRSHLYRRFGPWSEWQTVVIP